MKNVSRAALPLAVLALAAALSLLAPAAEVSGQKGTKHGRGKSTHAHGGGEKEGARARAEIKGDRVTGTAEFVEVERGTERLVRVTVRVKGDPSALTPGLHGVHLHEKGVCEPPFTSAGGHFDPGPAGNSDPDVNHPYHMGDLPNINVDAKGMGTLEAVTTRVTLSEGPLSVFDADGSAIIIHARQDQLTSGETKSGVSGGPRLACGVITRQ
ncbi:MAG TPA: superoxide dismutase family protein [Pyrinomonadaceae bacterium]|nr:superoxide dismutase family protein [Pyrinomonadaceae bacterium]